MPLLVAALQALFAKTGEPFSDAREDSFEAFAHRVKNLVDHVGRRRHYEPHDKESHGEGKCVSQPRHIGKWKRGVQHMRRAPSGLQARGPFLTDVAVMTVCAR